LSEHRVELTSATAWSDAQMDELFAEGFPPFITADLEVKRYIGRVRDAFPHLDIMLVSAAGEPVATGWGVPIRWNEDVDDLPSSFADVLGRAVALLDAEEAADTFVICGGVVHPSCKGTGLAAELVRSLIAHAATHGLGKVVAPLRPTRKHLYPLVGIDEYATWARRDGQPLDPWLRLHLRVGARVIALAPAAQTMTGSVRQWEEWTGLELPAAGDYVIPGGLSTLRVDRDADLGTYTEPNIWVRHR
jgi:GNAT superfamily N-acetyltransferase